jgi:putative ATP-dependent endonuclease of the OLD family
MVKIFFVVNCGSVTNIPFFQTIFSKFNIKYSVICDSDHIKNYNNRNNSYENPKFDGYIQKSIQDQFELDFEKSVAKYFFVFEETFEPAHDKLEEPFRFDNSGSQGKPFKANRYWEEKLLPNSGKDSFKEVPIIKYIQKILENK